jgi:hypothetical protein
MVDNGWSTFTIPNSPDALSPSGHYSYHLRVRSTNPNVFYMSNFKVRTDGVAMLIPQPFAYIAAMFTTLDRGVIYPAYPSLTPTTYNGEFEFHVYVPNSLASFYSHDGDLDFGSFDLTQLDTDDPDTPPGIPGWATSPPAVSEGVAMGIGGSTGNPRDDNFIASLVRSPSVVYQVSPLDLFPFMNDDPSGNLEWEQFRIENNPAVLADHYIPGAGYADDRLPAGLFHVRMIGMDINNLNAWRFPFRLIGVCVQSPEGGLPNPCKDELPPYMIGDTVFFDTNGDGNQDAGEPGIPGVLVQLFDGHGFPVLDVFNNQFTAVTDANGNYFFDVEGQRIDPITLEMIVDGMYMVRVAPENFDPGNPLIGMASTTGGEEITDTVINANVLTYDFGYTIPATGSVGDLVWKDRNANGLFEPALGDRGFSNMPVVLTADYNGDGVVDFTASTVTDGNGFYQFNNLLPGWYTARITHPALAAITPTYDFDGIATPDVASFVLGPGESNQGIDFGYALHHR